MAPTASMFILAVSMPPWALLQVAGMIWVDWEGVSSRCEIRCEMEVWHGSGGEVEGVRWAGLYLSGIEGGGEVRGDGDAGGEG